MFSVPFVKDKVNDQFSKETSYKKEIIRILS